MLRKPGAAMSTAIKRVRTPLGEILRERITKTGGISFAEFMKEAMCHPEHGYFTTTGKDKVIGGKGDFITAPELLPEFGWCYARWLEQAVLVNGAGEGEISLVELGPGTGRLMSHLLMYLKYEVGEAFLRKIHLRMLEVSPVMIEQQKDMLKPYLDHIASVEWHGEFDTVWASLPETPTYVTSNEYFDVLPVNIVSKVDGVWIEEIVKCDEEEGVEKFYLEKGGEWVDAAKYIVGDRWGMEAEKLEVCPPAIEAIRQIGTRIEKVGGMMLGIDYGKDIPSTNTLQGMTKQVTCSPLLNPGQIDISWHVDFSSLRDHLALACPSLSLTAAHPQRDFLTAMGFDALYEQRLKTGNLPEHYEFRRALLMDEEQMGGYHRAVGMCSKTVYPPPGFGDVRL
eukprot:TRINITY_DN42619_c0_g1_i1.p1 TRINITY_DN42619_c0_g1~~TRINITY_DN42619_c0_g1_i1.p1  ORF type:complete len:396 (+),score=60.11 TRINITY_DN42619_c0_g1_i1:66-1253(+)